MSARALGGSDCIFDTCRRVLIILPSTSLTSGTLIGLLLSLHSYRRPLPTMLLCHHRTLEPRWYGETHADGGTDLHATLERLPTVDCSASSRFTLVSTALFHLLHPFPTFIPFVPLLPVDSDRAEQCLFLFGYHKSWPVEA